MGPQDHLVIARELWDAIAEADAPKLRALLPDKCVWRMYGRSPLAGSFVGPDEIIDWMARIGELTSELRSELIDVLVSAAGAVLRYSVHAVRGLQTLDIEHLFLIRIVDGRIVEGVFAPIDQHRYDRFFTPQ